MKLYKFRPLANNNDFGRLKNILETGEFWCSKFSELNDPMEGTFIALNAPNVSQSIDSIYNQKEKYKICSFSNKKAFSNPVMWGYYANGFKGIVIEIEVCGSKVKQIEYVDEIPSLEELNFDMKVEKILTTKLSPWKHECEYRFLEKSDSKKIKIGKITALSFGDPYGRAKNKRSIIKNSGALKDYIELKDKILKLSKDLKLYSVQTKNCKVIKTIIKK